MKARRLAPMLQPLGYELIHYGVGEPDSPGWADHVEVLSPTEQIDLLGYDPLVPSSDFVGRGAFVDNACYRAFNGRLSALLAANVRPDDWILAPFGHAHQSALGQHLDQVLESGIGYPVCFAKYRIYESYAYFHWHMATENRNPWDSEWVIPNYFDEAEWPMRSQSLTATNRVLFLGRITPLKGLNIVWELAKARPDLEFILAGQGDATPWLTLPNLHAIGPVHGLGRAALMHHARCTLVPSQYVEPFGGVAVESMLTGTPVITSDHSAFTETVTPTTGMRCHTLGDWLGALDRIVERDPVAVRQAAMRYTLPVVGQEYHAVLQQLPALKRDGWYAKEAA